MKLRVGIVGCGKIADSHVEQARATDRADVVAVCDAEGLMAEQLALRLGVGHHYDDLARMLAEQKLDVLHVATPPGSHPAILRAAIAAHCHVFMEKPVALDASLVRSMTRDMAAAGLRFAPNFLYNFESPFLELQARRARGELGDIVHVDMTYGYDLGGAYGLAVLGDSGHWVHSLPGKLFHNVLDHVTCKLVPLLPEGPIDVWCHSARRRPATGNEVVDALDDELRCHVVAGGVTASLMISAHARPAGHLMRVFGTRDSAQLDFVGRTIASSPRQRQPGAIGRLGPAFDQARQFKRAAWRNVSAFRSGEYHFFQGMRRLLVQFYESINGGPDPLPADLVVRSCEAIDGIIAAMNRAKTTVPGVVR